jgi:glycosyltransferase involved in cell wall biosynthesis
MQELGKQKEEAFLVLPSEYKQHKSILEGGKHLYVDTQREWGCDVGALSPKILKQKLENVIFHSTVPDNSVLIYSFESSFSLLVALIGILRHHANVVVFLNFIDGQFWVKLFTSRLFQIFGFHWFIRKQIQKVTPMLLLTANSSRQAKFFTSILGVEVQVHNPISIAPIEPQTTKSSFQDIATDSNPKLLIIFWPVDIPFLMQLLYLIKENRPELFENMVIHSKWKDPSVREFVNQLSIFKPALIEEELSQEDYRNMINGASLSILCYTDTYHYMGGSGRVVDSLIAGVPVIVAKGGVVHDLALSLDAAFDFIIEDPNSVLHAIEKYENSPYWDLSTRKKYRENLKIRANENFSPSALVDRFQEFINLKSTSKIDSEWIVMKGNIGLWFELKILNFVWRSLRVYECISRTKSITND